MTAVREELVSSGASTTRHDMVLYLIARYAGATAAQDVARLFALQWHQDELTPYMIFEGRSDHGDSDIQSAQQWVSRHFWVANRYEDPAFFRRLFKRMTGLAPAAYRRRFRILEFARPRRS